MWENKPLVIADKTFQSRLLTGTGKFGNLNSMAAALKASETELVTVALKRVESAELQKNTGSGESILSCLKELGVHLLPNTSGVRTAKEAIFAAELAREALQTNWLKLEVHPDPKYLMPDPIETFKAAEELVKLGFVVLPYCGADPLLCKRLEDLGCAAVMPLGSAIGSNKGLQTQGMLEIIIDQANIPVIIDAGIGKPSDAALAMEMGASAALVNTAIAVAENPEKMGKAFQMAVDAGRMAYEAKLASISSGANASSPLTAFLDEED
jgi:thiazole synthase